MVQPSASGQLVSALASRNLTVGAFRVGFPPFRWFHAGSSSGGLLRVGWIGPMRPPPWRQGVPLASRGLTTLHATSLAAILIAASSAADFLNPVSRDLEAHYSTNDIPP